MSSYKKPKDNGSFNKNKHLLQLSIDNFDENELGVDEKLNFNLKYMNIESFMTLSEKQKTDYFSSMQALGDMNVKDMFNKKPTAKSKLYASYTNFPENRFFEEIPIPKGKKWARFRFSNLMRLVGFLVKHTFYIVYFDPRHEFYSSEKK